MVSEKTCVFTFFSQHGIFEAVVRASLQILVFVIAFLKWIFFFNFIFYFWKGFLSVS